MRIVAFVGCGVGMVVAVAVVRYSIQLLLRYKGTLENRTLRLMATAAVLFTAVAALLAACMVGLVVNDGVSQIL